MGNALNEGLSENSWLVKSCRHRVTDNPPELTTERVPSRLVRFTPVNVLPVYFSALNEPENDGIERLFYSKKSGTRRSFASVSLTETGAFYSSDSYCEGQLRYIVKQHIFK